MSMVINIHPPEALLHRQALHPIAVKAIRHPVGEVNGRQWLVREIFGVKNNQVAPTFLFAVHTYEQKALALG